MKKLWKRYSIWSTIILLGILLCVGGATGIQQFGNVLNQPNIYTEGTYIDSGGNGVIISEFPSTFTRTFSLGALTSTWDTGTSYGLTVPQLVIHGISSSGVPLMSSSGVINGTLATTTNLTEGTNLYYTQSRVRGSMSSTATGLSYDAAGGAFSLTNGYSIPSTTSTGHWDTAYSHSLLTSGNPHSVTKSDVGLSSVENTALSTWAGTGYISSVGTIGTGVWNATAITTAKGGTGLASSVGLGDTWYGSAANAMLILAGNQTVTKNFLSQTGDGAGHSAAPSWSTVTKSDVGLSNVENTALSTWAGSALITSVGNVAAGTWNGSTVVVAKGGTGLSTSAVGDLLYSASTNTWSALTGNGTATRKFLSMTSGTPSWYDLSNVENTALSTWAGTTNITTLGTITSSSTSDASKALNVTHTGANASGTGYAVYAAKTGAGSSSTNVGGYFSASGATNNYGIVIGAGALLSGVAVKDEFNSDFPTKARFASSGSANGTLYLDHYSAGTSDHAAHIVFRRARDSAIGTNTTDTNNSDVLGRINFYGVGGGGWMGAGWLMGAQDGNVANGHVPGLVQIATVTTAGAVNYWDFWSNGDTTIPSPTGTGGVAIGYSGGKLTSLNGSSRRYKENILPATLNTDAVYSLAPVTFNYKSDGRPNFGYIAEDVDSIGGLENLIWYENGIPESLNYDKLGIYHNEILKKYHAVMESETTGLKIKGGLHIDDNGKTQPACDSAVRGTIWVVKGGDGTADSVQVCLKDAQNNYSWRILNVL
jgi:hypothetical protein